MFEDHEIVSSRRGARGHMPAPAPALLAVTHQHVPQLTLHLVPNCSAKASTAWHLGLAADRRIREAVEEIGGGGV